MYKYITHFLPRSLIEVPPHIQVAQRDAEVSVHIGGATLPAGRSLLKAEHRARELEPEVAERGQGHRRHCREHAPPEETLWKDMINQ